MPAQIDQLQWMAEHHPEETAYLRLDTGDFLTFSQWEARANRLARGLHRLGAAVSGG